MIKTDTFRSTASPVPRMSAQPPTPTPPGRGAPVLVLNHQREACEALLTELERAGFETRLSSSIAATKELLESGALRGDGRPGVALLRPVALVPGGAETSLLNRLLQDVPGLPVIFVVDNVADLDLAQALHLPFCDFVLRPHSASELVRRVERARRDQREVMRLQQLARDLEGQVSVDFKTGLLSERHLGSVLQAECNRAQRHHLPLSLLLVDVDNFKGINDTTEYAFGDVVLAEVARVLKENTRESDYAARFGGDEFVLVLPHTTSAEAVKTAVRIRTKIAALVVRNGSYSHRPTVSIGIDTFDGQGTTTPTELRRRANKALHEAKRRGKDQVWLFSGDDRGAAPRGEESAAEAAGDS